MRGVVGNESILDTDLVDHLMGNQNTIRKGLTEIQNGQNKSQSNKSFRRPKMSVEGVSCDPSEKRDGLQENLILTDESGVRALKKITVFAAAAFMASTIGGVAQADTKMKCGCFDSAINIKAVESAASNAGYKAECVSGELWTNYENSLSVQEKNVKVYMEGGQKIIGDKDVKFRFRPRNGKCLDNVVDGVKKNVNWVGPMCDNGKYEDLSGFQLTRPEKDKAPTIYMASYQAQVSGPNEYKGFALYEKADDDKKYLMALCLQNK